MNPPPKRIQSTILFDRWLTGLKDKQAKRVVAARLDRVRVGNFGDSAPVGAGVSEMRIHLGPGYRIYFTTRSSTLVILLAGGDKSSQSRDIMDAKRIAGELRDKGNDDVD